MDPVCPSGWFGGIRSFVIGCYILLRFVSRWLGNRQSTRCAHVEAGQYCIQSLRSHQQHASTRFHEGQMGRNPEAFRTGSADGALLGMTRERCTPVPPVHGTATKTHGTVAKTHGSPIGQYWNLLKPYVCRTKPSGFQGSFCLETLSNGRCAVIDRAYSVDSATVGAVYDRPICSFETETSYEGLPSLDRMRERL